uniref:Uncharacterized protein n=1 Tax=Lygus hesperus TaxID=30085 RepID=A0A0A9YBH5_LYGHE
MMVFHLLLLQHIHTQASKLSTWSEGEPTTFTRSARRPVSIVLRRRENNVWAIDSTPSGSPRTNDILVNLGKSLELQLTMEPQEFIDTYLTDEALAKYGLQRTPVQESSTTDSNSSSGQHGERESGNKDSTRHKSGKDNNGSKKVDFNTHHYMSVGNILIRSQLDCCDPKLGTKCVFDLKTRATVPIRYDVRNFDEYLDYHIISKKGML